MLIPLVARAGVLAEVDSALTAARAGRGTLLTLGGPLGQPDERVGGRDTMLST